MSTHKVEKVRDVKVFDNHFKQMKKLNDEDNNDNNYNEHEHIFDEMFNENDYLPDDVNIDEYFPADKNTNNNNNHDTNVIHDDKPQPINNNDKQEKHEHKNNNNNKHNNNASTRKSSRVTSIPDRYIDNKYNNYVNYAFMSFGDEPQTYKEAMKSNDADKWIDAMKDELTSHNKNNTWTVVNKNNDMNIIGCKWVYKMKKNSDGKLEKYKARLVAKGYDQQYGIDYRETFAPVLKYKTLRVMLALSQTSKHIKMKQLDVKTAFLNAKVNENIYMSIPEGMNVINNNNINNNNNKVLKLNKALYGIKQAPNEWNKDINDYMVSIMKFTQCVKDTCVYTKISKNNNIIMFGLFVDDITTFYDVHDEHEYNVYINMLKQKYEMSDLGDEHNILGMRVTNRDDGLYLDQHTYIEEKLKYFNMINCNPMSTPESTTKLSSISNDNNNNNNNDIINEYRSIVGSLIYAAISTRPDINHAVNMVSRYMHNPTHDHMIAAKRILRYMSCTKDICIKYNNNTNSNNKNDSHEKYVKNKNNNNEKQNICTINFDVDTHEYEVDNESMSTMMTQEIVKEDIHKNKNNNNNKNIINVKAFCDADWGGDHEDRKSTTGYPTNVIV